MTTRNITEAAKTLAFLLILVAFGYAFVLWTHHEHDKTCTGATTGRCGWYWCRYYDGSDSLHDLTIR